MHSAKGLEFDHVIIIGLNDENTPHGNEPGDTNLENFRRILAMAITRAKKTVMIGYKQDQASALISYLDSSTYDEVTL
jgi:superfamily I DNA/RNA helicase